MSNIKLIIEERPSNIGNFMVGRLLPFRQKKKMIGHLYLLITAKTTIYIFGGEPFPEQRTIYWNFVASTKELIEQAKEKWLAQTFEKIPGETEFVPLLEQIKKQ